ncbi:alkaline-phosphatase-like protein [Xylogone sp. PMI_703]|nr:alkaline-phosphatase-like protein [Xylogone sp. PMI_703]
MGATPPVSPGSRRPNFLIIVADDLGFSDCGCYGSEIQTPNIDALVEESGALRFTSFYVAAACSPTRSMLMTGTDHHIAGLGQLAEFTRNSSAHRGQPGHEGYLNEHVVALPELLRDGGYHTMMSGKWHLGIKKEHHPQNRGFDKSFALIPGCANHFAWEPPYEDPKTEPPRMFETATRALHVEGDQWVDQMPDNWYSSDGYASKLITYFSARTEEEKEKPFLAYLPFSAPHWPLQAPSETVAKYKSVYNDGPKVLRERRLHNLKKLGMIKEDVSPHPVVALDWERSWEDLDDDDRVKSCRAMEVYAAMVDRMDWNIGRVISHLKETGEYDNTMIVFMSDNGTEGASIELGSILGDTITEHLAKYYDNSLDNIGNGNSFVWYGPHWAQAGTAPSRLYKMYSTEGGCRVPLVLKPHKDFAVAQENPVITDAFCTVMDFVPTILELAGLQHPANLVYNGRRIAPLRGRSWAPFLSSLKSPTSLATALTKTSIHTTDYAVGFEMCGSASLRRGDWKITYVPHPRGPQKWELFNIDKDPGEITNVKDENPAIFKDLLQLWEEYKKDVGVVGLREEYEEKNASNNGPSEDDIFSDPYGWIKYIKRPEITPDRLKPIIPV